MHAGNNESLKPSVVGQKTEDLAADLAEIALCCARRPVISDLTAEQVLGYDDSGIPTR